LSGSTRFTERETRQIREQRVWPRLVSIPITLVAILIATHADLSHHLLLRVALVLVTAYGFFCWTSIFHETAHQTLFGATWANVWLGRMLGTVMLVPYSVYRQVHIRHHAYLNRPEDWELWPYATVGTSLRFRRVYVWIDLLFGLLSSAFIYGRLYFHPRSPLQDRDVRRAIAGEYLGMIVFWGAFLAYRGATGMLPQIAMSIGLPMLIAGVLQTGRKFTEHLGMASFDPLLGTRTVLPQRWLLQVCSFLHFDIFVHGPHHRHPRATHGTLRGRMEDYLRKSPQLPYPVFASYASAIWHMLPSLWRNPGCGVNAGALPEHANLAAVEDFLADSLDVEHEYAPQSLARSA
jgi:fatty acid desaturase